MTRTLSLRREALAELSNGELAAVDGAAIPTILGVCQWTQPSSPINCITENRTCPLCPE